MQSAKRPLTAKGQTTRARLIAAARSEAIRTGGHIEVAAVAARAGVVPSLINRYFGSKPRLVCALVDDFFDRLHTEVLDLDLDGEGGWAEQERLRLTRAVAFHYADPFAVVLYGQLTRDPEVARTETVQVERIIRHAAVNVRRGQERGDLPGWVDPDLAGAAMFGAMRQVLVAVLRRSPPPQHEVAEVLWRQVAASVAIAPPAATDQERDPPR